MSDKNDLGVAFISVTVESRRRDDSVGWQEVGEAESAIGIGGDRVLLKISVDSRECEGDGVTTDGQLAGDLNRAASQCS